MNIIKKHKVFGIGACVLLVFLGIAFGSHRALAATTQDQAFAGCVENVINVVQKGNSGDTATQCKLDDPNGNANLIYATNDVQTIENGNFKASGSTVSVSNNGVTVTIPQSIELLDSNNKSLVYTSPSQAIAYASLRYTQIANTSSVYSDAHIYEVYYPTGGDHTFAFLTQVDNNGDLRILAMVNTTMQSGSPNFVYAATINKVAESSSSTGSPISTPSTVSSVCSSGTCSSGSGQLSSGTSCEDNGSFFSLAWIFCPLLESANQLTNGMVNLFEGQLSFRIADLNGLSGAGQGANQVHASWSLIRDIASSLLVIIMLVMVLSQAVSFGPFDAYTIKKIMPKLVIAVILMQVSWGLFALIVDIFDDIGHGLTNIMYLPFGGAGQMNLFSLLGNAHIGGWTVTGLNFAILAAGFVAIATAFLPFFLGIMVGAIISLSFGLFTLVFRKILIIMLLILSPLALVAWILPGTQTYWKMWRENFTKALMMYPIAVAIIAAGRIFAKIAGGQNDSEFLNLIFVFVGFFGPLVILPKTFKWGGQAMQMAGNGVMKARDMAKKYPDKYFKNMQEEWSKENRRQSQERYKNEVGFDPRRPWRRPLDLAGAGQLNPLRRVGPGSHRRLEEASTHYKVAGAKSEKEEIESENTAAQLAIERIHPDEQDTYGRALASGQKLKISSDGRLEATRFRTNTDGDWVDTAGNVIRRGAVDHIDEHGNLLDAHGNILVNISSLERDQQNGSLLIDRRTGVVAGADDAEHASLTEQRAGLDQIARLGGEGNIEHIQRIFEQAMNSGDTDRIEMMNKFTTANVQSLFKKLPHIYKNNNYAIQGHPEEHDVLRTVNGLNPEDITGLSGVGMRTLRDHLIARANDASLTTAQRDDAVAGLQRLTAVFSAAASDRSLKGRIPADVARAMRDLADNRAGVRSSWGLSETLNEIASAVDERGIVRDEPQQQPQAPSPTTLRKQHIESATRILPAPAAVRTRDSAVRESFKLRLKSDPSAIETLANNIAYGSAPPEYYSVLEEMRDDAQRTGTPEAVSEYNNLVAYIQEAMRRRIEEQTQAATARGYDAVRHRQYAEQRIAPQIVDLEPGGTIDIRKLHP